MSDFNVRSESVDVEQIMEQIRARIRDKRGVDYTEQQLRDLAAVKLEKFLDPRGVRSDLLQRFKERQPPYEKPLLPLYTFEDTTIYETHRGPLQWIRRLLNPILKLLFNPNPVIHALHAQVEINALNLEREEAQEKRRLEMESLYYEIIHNLVFEMTRTGIEVKNLKMRVESLASRLEFNERRARALERVVVYKPSAEDQVEPMVRESGPDEEEPQVPAQTPQSPVSPGGVGAPPEGPGQRSRRRRRRRGRRSGAPASAIMGAPDERQPNRSSEGERPGTIEPAIPAESHAGEPPAPNDPAQSTLQHAQSGPEPSQGTTPSGQSSSTGAAEAATSAPSGDPSTLRQAQDVPEADRGTTSSGSTPAASRGDDPQ
jgi:hypothetical protein